MAEINELLNRPFELTPEQVSFYQKNGFIKLKNVLDRKTISFFNKVITSVVHQLNQENTPLDHRDTYGKAFLQLMNLWRQDPMISELVLSRRLGWIAANLLQVRGVRLYHDQALFKEPGGGITPWHADQYYWPLATDKCVTAWIPLQETPLTMGPIEFSAGSQQISEGRELDISDESEKMISERLRVTDYTHVVEPFEAGEISFHSGWVFHRAGGNTTDRMRKAMTVIYMDQDMRLKAPENERQRADWDTWCTGARVGEVIDTKLNPVICELN